MDEKTIFFQTQWGDVLYTTSTGHVNIERMLDGYFCQVRRWGSPRLEIYDMEQRYDEDEDEMYDHERLVASYNISSILSGEDTVITVEALEAFKVP